MDVRLDEPGKHVATARVDDAVVRLVDVRRDGSDSAVFDRDVALDDVEAIVHRQDQTRADKKRSHSYGRAELAPLGVDVGRGVDVSRGAASAREGRARSAPTV